MNRLHHILDMAQRCGLLVLVFLLPWQTHYLIREGILAGGVSEYLSWKLFVVDLLLLALVLLATVHGEKLKNVHRRRGVPLAGLLAIAFVAIYWATNPEAAFHGWLRLVEGILLVFVVLRTRVTVTELLVAFVFAGAVQGAFAIVQFFAQVSFESSWLGIALHDPATLGTAVVETPTGRWLRAYGAFSHPNILGGFLALTLTAAFALLLRAREQGRRVFVYWSMMMITAGLLASFSRTAWLAAAVGVALFGLFMWIGRQDLYLDLSQGRSSKALAPHYTVIKGLLVVLIVCGAFMMVFSDLVISRVAVTGRIEERSITDRAQYTGDAFDVIGKKWVIGVGVGNITPAVYKQVDSKREVYAYQPPHNVLLLVFAELGFFGLIIFIFLFIDTLLLRETHDRRVDQPHLHWWLATALLMITMLILLFFDHYLWSIPQGILLFWLIIAFRLKSLHE